MRRIWFVPWGWLHYQVSAAGIVVTLAAVAYMAQVFVAANGHSHSVSDMLYAVYLHWGVTFLGWDWIARRTSPPATG